jgi:hypothetical protein
MAFFSLLPSSSSHMQRACTCKRSLRADAGMEHAASFLCPTSSRCSLPVLVLSTLVAHAADKVNYSGSQACCAKASEPTVEEKGGLLSGTVQPEVLQCLAQHVQD